MTNLHWKYVLEKRKVARLRKRVKDLVADHGVQVSKDMDKDLKDILKENFASIAEKYHRNSFQRIFWSQHSQAAAAKDVRGVRWHPAMIRWCLYLRHLSGKAYETLRESGVLTLPSQRTLRDYTHYVSSKTGFSNDVDIMLKESLKVSLMQYSCLVIIVASTVRSKVVLLITYTSHF